MLAEQVTAKIQIDANTQSGGDSVVEIVEMSTKIICIFGDEKNKIMYYRVCTVFEDYLRVKLISFFLFSIVSYF